jgi:hypothetical protein
MGEGHTARRSLIFKTLHSLQALKGPAIDVSIPTAFKNLETIFRRDPEREKI